MINVCKFEGNKDDIKALEKLILTDWNNNDYEYKMTLQRSELKNKTILIVVLEVLHRKDYSNFVKMVTDKIWKQGLIKKIKFINNGEVFNINNKGVIQVDVKDVTKTFDRYNRLKGQSILKSPMNFIVFVEGKRVVDLNPHLSIIRKLVTDAMRAFGVNRRTDTHAYEYAAIYEPIRNLYANDEKFTKGKALCYRIKYDMGYDFLQYLNNSIIEYNRNLEGSVSSFKPILLLANEECFDRGDEE
jgi:hypothetical protein